MTARAGESFFLGFHHFQGFVVLPDHLDLNWLQVFGVGESVFQYGGKAGENAMRVKRQDVEVR